MQKITSWLGLPYVDRMDESSVVIDIGANAGKFSRQMVKKYGCKVVSYEPCRGVLDKLMLVDGIDIRPRAVGHRKGMVKFYDYGYPYLSGSMLERVNYEDVQFGGDYELKKTYSVECVAFKDVINEFDSVDLVKIDVEGAEFDMIKKTPESVLKKCKQITIEIHWGIEKGLEYSLEDTKILCERLCGMGFKFNTNGTSNTLFYREL